MKSKNYPCPTVFLLSSQTLYGSISLRRKNENLCDKGRSKVEGRKLS